MRKKIYQRFLITFIFSVGILLGFIMVFNFFVDPGNEFFHGAVIERKMAQALLQNKSVIVQSNYNERLLQKMMLQKLSFRPDILILGSSHIMPLTHATFHTARFFNASVSSASLQDDMALYSILQKRGFQPKVVIICLDPWIVSKSNPQQLWKSEYRKEYQEVNKLIIKNQGLESLAFINQIISFFEKYLQLLSSAYLESSINKFKNHIKSKNNQDILEDVMTLDNKREICANCFVRQPDGARLPTPAEEAMTSSDSNLYVMNHINSWKDFWTESTLSSSYAFIFDRFIQYLLKQGVEVVFYFPPLQPLEYSQVVKNNQNYQMVFIAEKYFKMVAKKYQLKTIGAYDPAQVDLFAADFIDNWHLKKEGIKKIFTNGHITGSH